MKVSYSNMYTIKVSYSNKSLIASVWGAKALFNNKFKNDTKLKKIILS